MLSLFGDPDPPSRAGSGHAILVSVGIHVAVAALLTAAVAGLGMAPETKPTHWRVQLLQLRAPPAADHAILHFSQLQIAKEAKKFAVSKHRAPQTLIVAGAPPNFELPAAIPAPFVLPGMEAPSAETASRSPLLAPGEARTSQTANVLSIPDIPSENALLVPKVNETAGSSAGAALPSSASSDAGEGKLPNVTRIDLPPDGHFPASVLGSSISNQYPDIEAGLAGRVVATVYLQIGRKNSWALEFWAPGVGSVDAPWAYEVYRPNNLGTPPEVEAILISGVINPSGRLENLHLLLPPELAGKDALLGTLEHWRFRPASRKGVPIEVQVLLIIPLQRDEE
jgi:hypothetical protein